MERFCLKVQDPVLLREERDRVLDQLSQKIPGLDVREVGSTAIAGVIGKGDIDLLARCNSEIFPQVREQLDRLFLRNPDQLSNQKYQGYLVDSPYGIDIAIQLTIIGCDYDDFIPFLHALQQDPTLVQQYNALKRRYHGHPMEDYRRAKSTFITSVLNKS